MLQFIIRQYTVQCLKSVYFRILFLYRVLSKKGSKCTVRFTHICSNTFKYFFDVFFFSHGSLLSRWVNENLDFTSPVMFYSLPYKIINYHWWNIKKEKEMTILKDYKIMTILDYWKARRQSQRTVQETLLVNKKRVADRMSEGKLFDHLYLFAPKNLFSETR